MKKKLLTVALAATMVMGSVFSAFAATEVDCTGWWVAHSDGFEIDADGVEVTFKNTSYDTAAANWNSPAIVVYTGDEAKVNGTGYTEYAVIRSDNFAWAPDGINGANTPIGTDGKFIVNTGDGKANWDAAGYTIESTGVPADDAEWATWFAANKAGVDCKVKATKSGSNVVVEFTNGTITSKTTIPVDASKTIYVSLTGELCKLTNITEVAASGNTNDATTTEADNNDAKATSSTAAKTGDSTTSMIALLAVVAVGASLVVLATKRSKVTE